MVYTYEYPRPAVTVDVAVISKKDGDNFILLIQRKKEPFKDFWALPGGFMDIDETLAEAALRELKEETGLDINALEQFFTYDAIDRDPRHRTISTVFISFLNNVLPSPSASDDAADARWFSLQNLPPLAFDHAKIVADIAKKYNLV